jgi:hypothetical protein
MTCSRCSWPSLVPSMSIFLTSTIPIGHSLSTEWDVRCWKVTWSVRGHKGLSWRRLDRASLFIFRGFSCNCYQFENEYKEKEILLYYGVCQIQIIVPGVRCLQKIWLSPLGASQNFLIDSKTDIITCAGMLHYVLAFISICISVWICRVVMWICRKLLWRVGLGTCPSKVQYTTEDPSNLHCKGTELKRGWKGHRRTNTCKIMPMEWAHIWCPLLGRYHTCNAFPMALSLCLLPDTLQPRLVLCSVPRALCGVKHLHWCSVCHFG